MARVLSFYIGTDQTFWTAIADEGKPFSVTIGRTGQSDLVLPTNVSDRARATVSRVHARIFRQDETVRIEDLNSSNLTTLNGRIVLTPMDISFPATVQVGSVRIEVKHENLDHWKENEAARPTDHDELKANAKATVAGLETSYRDEIWNQVRGELRWVTALQDILNLVSQGRRADDSERRLKEVLKTHLVAKDIHTAFGLPVEQVKSYLEKIGLDVAAADAIHLHVNQTKPEKPLVRVAMQGGAGFAWGVRSINATDPTASLVLAYTETADRQAMENDRADAIVAESMWIARPYIEALRELEEQKASRTESVPHEPSAAALVVCEEEQLWGESAGFRRCIYQAELAATRYLNRADSSKKLPVIYFQGESGTGKSALARLVHRLSAHRGQAFHELNCAAIPVTLAESELFGYERGAHDKAFTSKQGYFEIANGGTLFLDEIGKTTKEFQSKLLKVLDAGEFTPLGATKSKHTNCYVILADSEDPIKMCDEDRLLRELWYRVGAFTITLPAVRERIEDVELLVERRIRSLNEGVLEEEHKEVSAETVGLLKSYAWPGNIRELMQCVEVAYSMSPHGDRYIRVDHLPDGFLRGLGVATNGSTPDNLIIDPDRSLADHIATLERRYLATMIGTCEGNLSEVTRRSGKAYQTVLNKLKEFRGWLDAADRSADAMEIESLKELAGEHWDVIAKR